MRSAGLLALDPPSLGSAGTVFVNCATVDPALSSRLAEQGKSRNCTFMSAPMFGRPDAAAAKKCLVVASGPPAAMERVRHASVSKAKCVSRRLRSSQPAHACAGAAAAGGDGARRDRAGRRSSRCRCRQAGRQLHDHLPGEAACSCDNAPAEDVANYEARSLMFLTFTNNPKRTCFKDL